MKLLITLFASASCYFLSSRPKYITQGPTDETFSPYLSFLYYERPVLTLIQCITDNAILLCSVMLLVLNSVMLRRNILDLLVAGVLSKTSCIYSQHVGAILI